jgi:ornithine cyclodeaminase
MRILSGPDIRAAVPMRDAIAAVRDGFLALRRGPAVVPVRARLPMDTSGVSLYMPGIVAGVGMGVKAVAVAPENARRGLPALHAAVLLQDATTGAPLGLLEGGALTALRTGAASGWATDLLARREPSVVAMIGAGAQARTQLEAVCAVRAVTQVRVYCRDLGRRTAFVAWAQREPWAASLSIFAAPNAELAVRGADVILTATNATDSLFAAHGVKDGAHINAVGAFTPAMREIPAGVVARARVFVDELAAAREEAGDLIQAANEGGFAWSRAVELAAVEVGAAEGRTSPGDVTLFKSVGHAIQDLAVGMLALRRAGSAGLGIEAPW